MTKTYVELEKEVQRLREHVRVLTDALVTIAGFAPGNGDVCEIIARRARAALAETETRP